jgi:hypothetical protein
MAFPTGPDDHGQEGFSERLAFEPVIPRHPRKRFNVRILIASAVLLVGGAATAWYFLADVFFGGESYDVPVIEAAEGPLKVRPERPGGMKVPNRDKLVYDRMRGEGEPPRVEHLLPPPEKLKARPKASATIGIPPKSKPLPPKPPIAAPAKPAPAVPTAAEVRSLKKPQPAPTPPGPKKLIPKNMKPATPPETAKKPAVVAPEPPAPPKPPVKVAAEKPKPAPKPAAQAPKPQPKPVAKPAPAPKPPVKAVAAVQPPKKAVSAAPGGSKAYKVQLAAVRTNEAAQGEWKRLRGRNTDILGPLKLTVVKADLGAKGIFYRLQAGPLADETAARALCAKLKERRIGCLLVRPR